MYFITAMTNVINLNTRFDSEESKKHSKRCFGYFREVETAREAVTNNWADIHETIYTFALIEKIGEGIHPSAEIVAFYQFDDVTRKYIEIPWEWTGFCNYAIG